VALAACRSPHPETELDLLPDSGITSSTDQGLPILGTFTDEFGTTHEIDEARWVQTFPGYDPMAFDIAGWDPAGWLVAQNDAANAFDPEMWSRFQWLDAADGHLYYCQTEFAAPTRQDAEASASADPTDLDAGCGGFSWTDLTP
jgi:hypothetical protein